MLPEKFKQYRVLDIPVSATTLETASHAIHAWSLDSVGRYVCIRDVHGIMQAIDDPALAQLHNSAAMVTPDGMPLVWLGKAAGMKVERTCGPDLIEKVISDSQVSGLRHYFYGGKPGVAEKLSKNFSEKFPGINIAGTSTPPFRPLTSTEIAEVAAEFARSGADVVWIGLSTPKQEFLMAALAPLCGCTLIGVGAAFDFHTGEVKRAPRWLRKTGLESVYRLASEPKRLWRRYLIHAPRFVWAVATQKRKGEAND